MSITSKITIFVVTIILFLAGFWWLYSSSNNTTNTLQQNNSAQNTQNDASTESVNYSDTALQNDLSSIDNQIKGLNNDSVNIDQSINQ